MKIERNLFIILLLGMATSGSADEVTVTSEGKILRHITDCFVDNVKKKEDETITLVHYVFWDAKKAAISYVSEDYQNGRHTLSASLSVEADRRKFLTFLFEKGTTTNIKDIDGSEITLHCLTATYSLPGYILLGSRLSDDTFLSLVTDSENVHLIHFKNLKSVKYIGRGRVSLELIDGTKYEGKLERRSYGSYGTVWTVTLCGLSDDGKFVSKRMSDIESLQFLQKSPEQ